MTSMATLSREWIASDTRSWDSPIGFIDDFEYMYAPDVLAENAMDVNAMTGTNCGPTADAACTVTCFCTTFCGPLTTEGVCGC